MLPNKKEGGEGEGEGRLKRKEKNSPWPEPKPQIPTLRYESEGAALCAANPNVRIGTWPKYKAPFHPTSLPCK